MYIRPVHKNLFWKGWQAIAKLKPLSLFISLLLMLKKAVDNVKKEKWKVKVVSALQWLASPFIEPKENRSWGKRGILKDFNWILPYPIWIGLTVKDCSQAQT